MAELQDPSGQPVEAEKADIEREFAAAMGANGDSGEPAAPPKRAPTESGKPAPKRRGRPPKSEKARVDAGKPAGLSDEQRTEGIKGLVQLGAGLCLVASKASGQDAFRADAITLASSAEDWAGACVQVARQDEKFARVVDKVCAAGPYSALISVAVSTSMQLVRNHRPAAVLPGTVPPAELIRQAEAQSEPEPMAA